MRFFSREEANSTGATTDSMYSTRGMEPTAGGSSGGRGGEVGWSSAIVCRIAERFLPQQRVVVNVPSLVIRRHGKRPVKLKFPPARSKNLHTRNHVGRLGGGTMSDFKTKIWLGPFWLQSQSGGYMFSRLGMWKWAATVNRAGEWG